MGVYMPGIQNLSQNYIKGMDYYKNKDFQCALHYLQVASKNLTKEDDSRNKVLSALGMVKVFTGDKSGLSLCRNVASTEHFDADVFFHLAKAECKAGYRRQSIKAIISGLKISSSHKGLKNLQLNIGKRRKKAIPFLSRNNSLNIMFGKMTYQSEKNKAKFVTLASR